MHEIISHFMLIRLNMVISVSVFNVEFSTQFHKSFFFLIPLIANEEVNCWF